MFWDYQPYQGLCNVAPRQRAPPRRIRRQRFRVLQGLQDTLLNVIRLLATCRLGNWLPSERVTWGDYV